MKTTIRQFDYQVSPSGEFWQSVASNEWEPELFDVLNKFLTPNSIVFDIGAWIGPVTLYSSKLCGWCYSIEPDASAYIELQRNVKDNQLDNVTIHNVAVMGYSGVVDLGVSGNLGDSGTTWSSKKKQFTIPCLTLSQLADRYNLSRVDFVKIDVEGAEESIVQDLAFFEKFHPTVHLSIHDSMFLNPEKAKEAIWKLRRVYNKCYDSYQHTLLPTEWAGQILLTDNEL